MNKGGGELFVRLISKSRPLIDNTPAFSQNLKLDVLYLDMKGEPIDPSHLLQGTDFQAVVKVSNISGFNYTDLALTHILPAGWEVFNERLTPSENDDSNRGFTYQDIRDDRVLTYFDLPYNRSRTISIRLQA